MMKMERNSGSLSILILQEYTLKEQLIMVVKSYLPAEQIQMKKLLFVLVQIRGS